MGKGVGILGTISGKVGSMVYYRLTNSNNGEKQGYREYRATTRNPQTDQQLDQRVKMAVVTNEYRALRDVIRRGQQSFEYGDASRRAWLKMALGADFVGPYLDKGDKSPLPMPNVPISVGGLPEVLCNYVDEDGHARTSLAVDGSLGSTVGSLAYALLRSNPWLQEGDQITVVFCIPAVLGQSDPGVGTYYYSVTSFELYPSSSVSLTSIDLSVFVDTDLNVVLFSNDAESVVACAVIVSREGAAGEHLRSTARFGLADVLTNYYASLDPAQARRSYKRGETAAADWPVEQEPGVGTTPVSAITLNGSTVSVSDVAVVQGYLKASGYFLKVTALTNPKYNRYFTSLASSSTTQPDGATNTNTIAVDPSDTSAIQRKFTQWLIDQGMNAQYLYIGEN